MTLERVTNTHYPPPVIETREDCCGQWGSIATSTTTESMWWLKEWYDERPISRRDKPPSPWFSPTALSLAKRGKHTAGKFRWEHLDQQYTCPSLGAPSWMWGHYSLRSTRDVWRAMDHPPSFPTTNIDETRAAQGLLKKIDDTGLNLSSFVAEIDETANMFTDLARRASRGVRSMRHAPRDIRRRRERGGLTWRDANDAHLLASFGLAPTLDDVHSIVEYFNEGRHLAKPIVTRFMHIERDSKSVVHDPSTVYDITRQLTTRRTTSCKWIIYVKWLPLTSDISIGNPVEWIYERIPLSFMLDYFCTLGDSIALLDALQGVEKWAGTRSNRELVSFSQTQDGQWGLKSNSWGCRPNGGTASIQGIYQDTWTTLSPEMYEEESHERIKLLPSFFNPGNLVPRWEPSPSVRKLELATSVLAGLARTPQARVMMSAGESFLAASSRAIGRSR